MKTLFSGGTLVTCDAVDTVIEGGLLVDDGKIVARGKISKAELRKHGAVRVVDARGCAVLPGLVQAHVHLCQALFRGMADDLPLLEWLRLRVWPLEAAHDTRSLRASAELGLAEMMLAGTTTILDMGTVHDYDAVFDACARSGVRAMGGKAMMDAGDGVPKRLSEATMRSLDASDELAKRWTGAANGRLGYAYAPRFVLSCTEPLFRGVAERSAASGALMHSHIAEHPAEREAVRRALGDDDVAVLREWGFFGKRAILAHGVQLRDEEMERISRDGTRIVHCPSANLKLGSGIADVQQLDDRGVALALGADGAPCNNNMDPWIELRRAALLAKAKSSTTALPARRALRLATIDGAVALGLDHQVGSLEVGKRADVVVVRLDGVHAEPGGDVFSKLVYACTSRDVEHVMIDGELVVKGGEHTRLDVARVKAQAREQARKVIARSGV
ncbi:MAG: amidohydrolase family protein [Myxococcales bacterium]|nr:amidohydrolase family protein [Myxococcales bacterium]